MRTRALPVGIAVAVVLLASGTSRGAVHDPVLSRAVGYAVVCHAAPEWRAFLRREGLPDAAAYTWAAGKTVLLPPRTCAWARSVREEPRGALRRQDAALGAFVLAHERAHLRGVSDETRAYRLARRWMEGVAVRLGASPSYARALVRWLP